MCLKIYHREEMIDGEHIIKYVRVMYVMWSSRAAVAVESVKGFFASRTRRVNNTRVVIYCTVHPR